ncbi:hypothetical protein B7494_g3531 [Chlorociboria aeruginascens]|nr:hypothetical protein B7494_g3531 [Chlorociboria aeruginascens]
MSYHYPPVPVNAGVNFTRTVHADTYPAISSSSGAYSHAGRTVFITGASRGVGRETALSFAKAGASHIAIGARGSLTSVASEIQAAAKSTGKTAPRVLELRLDVCDHSSVEAAYEEIKQQFGRLDILINNAGYLSTFETIGDSDPDEYWKNYEVNMRGVYWITRAFLPLMLEDGEKTIVNLSSIGAHNLRYGGSGYQTTKFALLRFTEHLLVEYAEQGLLAYCVHPGGILTEMGKRLPQEMHGLLGDTPAVAADVMCFLAAERREWLAGRYISCTWDMPELLSRKEEIVDNDKLKMRMTF